MKRDDIIECFRQWGQTNKFAYVVYCGLTGSDDGRKLLDEWESMNLADEGMVKVMAEMELKRC